MVQIKKIKEKAKNAILEVCSTEVKELNCISYLAMNILIEFSRIVCQNECILSSDHQKCTDNFSSALISKNKHTIVIVMFGMDDQDFEWRSKRIYLFSRK